MAYRILVTGSRDWDDEQAIRDAIADVAMMQGDDFILVHGAARGADSLAAQVVDGWGGKARTEAHPADWHGEGRAAGILRNQRMVDLGADICLAFPKGESRGTRDCIRRAEKAGIPVRIYEG
jgi:hypothetical protein